VNSQGIIGVVSKAIVDQALPSGKLIVALDKLSDPGNLGTIMRICYWFGVDRLLLSRESVEIYNPKVIRSSQGALFNLKINEGVNLDEILVKFHEVGIKVILSDLQSNIYLSDYEVAPDKNYVLVFGNESSGISENITADSNYTNLKIKGFTSCESLNVSVSAGIVLNFFKTKLQ
jgi:TrmH family RNA methyltransferase